MLHIWSNEANTRSQIQSSELLLADNNLMLWQSRAFKWPNLETTDSNRNVPFIEILHFTLLHLLTLQRFRETIPIIIIILLCWSLGLSATQKPERWNGFTENSLYFLTIYRSWLNWAWICMEWFWKCCTVVWLEAG